VDPFNLPDLEPISRSTGKVLHNFEVLIVEEEVKPIRYLRL